MGIFDTIGNFFGGPIGQGIGSVLFGPSDSEGNRYGGLADIGAAFMDRSAQRRQASDLMSIYQQQNPYDPYRRGMADRLEGLYGDPSGALSRIPGYEAAAQGIVSKVGREAAARGLNYSTSTLVEQANQLGQLGLGAFQKEQDFLAKAGGAYFEPSAAGIAQDAAGIRAGAGAGLTRSITGALGGLFGTGGGGGGFPRTPGINPNAPAPSTGGSVGTGPMGRMLSGARNFLGIGGGTPAGALVGAGNIGAMGGIGASGLGALGYGNLAAAPMSSLSLAATGPLGAGMGGGATPATLAALNAQAGAAGAAGAGGAGAGGAGGTGGLGGMGGFSSFAAPLAIGAIAAMRGMSKKKQRAAYEQKRNKTWQDIYGQVGSGGGTLNWQGQTYNVAPGMQAKGDAQSYMVPLQGGTYLEPLQNKRFAASRVGEHSYITPVDASGRGTGMAVRANQYIAPTQGFAGPAQEDITRRFGIPGIDYEADDR